MSPYSAVRWHAVAPSNDDQAHLVYIEDYESEDCQFYSNEELKRQRETGLMNQQAIGYPGSKC